MILFNLNWVLLILVFYEFDLKFKCYLMFNVMYMSNLVSFGLGF